MQLLTLAGTIFLVAFSVAAPGAERVGPCTKARQDAGQPMPGKYIPQCTEHGFFKPTQCHASIGRCWCVVPDNGNPFGGTTTGEPDCTVCHTKRAEALRPSGTVGNFVPKCDEDGLFNPTQNWGSTGQTWCVDRKTGTEVQGTRTGPGSTTVNCTAMAQLAGLSMYNELDNKGPCYQKILEAQGHEGTPGIYIPACTEKGYYITEQRHSSTGFSWCVNPATGAEISGTRRSATEQRANCGVCFKEVEEKLTRKPVLGMELPQCNQETGEYLPEQHNEGYRWCANPKTGAVEGKKYPPGDRTPLPCVNN